jgi:hypothetical protein
MHSRESWITHKGKQILVRDYSGLSGQEAIDTITAFVETTHKLADRGQTRLKILSVMNNSFGDKKTLAVLKELGSVNHKYNNYAAIIGLEGVQQFLFNIIQTKTGFNSKGFTKREDALNWLAEK